VDSGNRLFMPVLRDVGNKDTEALRTELDELKDQIHRRAVPLESLRGLTFTLSNFGTFSGRYANPVILPLSLSIIAP